MCKNTHSLLWLLKRVWAHVETESRDTNQLKSLMKHEVTTLEVQREEQKGGRSKDNSDVKRLQGHRHHRFTRTHRCDAWQRAVCPEAASVFISLSTNLKKRSWNMCRQCESTAPVQLRKEQRWRGNQRDRPSIWNKASRSTTHKTHSPEPLASFHKPDNTEAQRWTVFDFFNNTFLKNEASTKVSKTAVPLMATRGSHSRSVPTDSWVKLEAEIKSVGLILLYNKPTLASVSLITKLFSLIHGLEVRGVVALTDRRSLTAAKWSHCVCAFQSIFNGIV